MTLEEIFKLTCPICEKGYGEHNNDNIAYCFYVSQLEKYRKSEEKE
jgi:hypothetical protein